MFDVVVDSCVVAKWVLPESDSAQAHQLISGILPRGGRLFALDIARVEVGNAIWKRAHRTLISADEARVYLTQLGKNPARVVSSAPLLAPGLDIAMKYDRAFYDALFVALANHLKLPGITSDEPLHRAVHADFPNIILLRDWQPPP